MNEEVKVIGYKPLTDKQKIAMNRIKKLGNELNDLLTELKFDEDLLVDQRSMAVAATELQTGFMWANRAIAKPVGFC